MVTIERIDSFNSIDKASWDSLLGSCRRQYIFQTYEFQSTWWKHFGEPDRKKRLLLLMLKDNGSVVGIAPLFAEEVRIVRRPVIRFIGTPICDFMDFLIVRDREPEIVPLIYDYLRKLKCLEIDLSFIPEGSRMLGSPQMRSVPVDESPYIDLDKDWDTTFNRLNTSIRKYVARRERVIARVGPVALERVQDKKGVDAFLDEYFKIHVVRWRDHEGRYSQFQYPTWRAFVRELCGTFFASGCIDLSRLRLRSDTIACHFGFIYDRVFHWYMPAYNPDYFRYSPGNIFIMRLLRDSVETGLSCFDFLRGTEPYKVFWTDSARKLYACIGYPDDYLLTKTGQLMRSVRTFYQKQVKGRLKRLSPLMWLWYRSRGLES